MIIRIGILPKMKVIPSIKELTDMRVLVFLYPCWKSKYRMLGYGVDTSINMTATAIDSQKSIVIRGTRSSNMATEW